MLSLIEEEELPIILGDFFEDSEIPLDEARVGANETLLISTFQHNLKTKFLILVSAKVKIPLSILNDTYCEELAHHYLLPIGKFGYKVEREVALTPNKYFNQRLLNYKQTFATEADYIFYVHSVCQQLNMNSCISIAMKKVSFNQLIAGMLIYLK